MLEIAFSRHTALTFAAAGFLLLPALAQTQVLDVIYISTPQVVVDRMLEMAEVKATDYVIDLGCGDGRMVVTAARKYGAHGYGVDINPVRINESNDNAKKAGVIDKVTFKVANLFEENMSKADVMTMYLLDEINLSLRPKILSELKPGSRVVSHAFDMGTWPPDATDVVDRRLIFLWYVPAKVEGKWQIEGEQTMTLDLTQEFQMVLGKATVGGRVADVSGKLKGTEITLTVMVDGKSNELRGVVENGEIKGSGGTWRGRQT